MIFIIGALITAAAILYLPVILTVFIGYDPTFVGEELWDNLEAKSEIHQSIVSDYRDCRKGFSSGKENKDCLIELSEYGESKGEKEIINLVLSDINSLAIKTSLSPEKWLDLKNESETHEILVSDYLNCRREALSKKSHEECLISTGRYAEGNGYKEEKNDVLEDIDAVYYEPKGFLLHFLKHKSIPKHSFSS